MMNAELNSICTRIARLETERKELAAEISKIKKDAKDSGFDAALITKTVSIMLKSGKKRREALDQHELFDTYLNAVGLLTEAQIEAGRPGPASTGEADVKVAASASPSVDVKSPPEVAELPAHDPETGEVDISADAAKGLAHLAKVSKTVAGSSNPSPTAAGDGLDASLVPSPDQFPDVPGFLDRRAIA